MRLLLAFIMCLLCVSAQAQRRIAVMTDTNGAIINPTNIDFSGITVEGISAFPLTADANASAFSITNLSSLQATGDVSAAIFTPSGTPTSGDMGLGWGSGGSGRLIISSTNSILLDLDNNSDGTASVFVRSNGVSTVITLNEEGDGVFVGDISGATVFGVTVGGDISSATNLSGAAVLFVGDVLTPEQTTNAIDTAIADATVNSWEYAATNTLWVSADHGSDATAVVNDPTLAWATIAAAMTNAISGDTIRITAGSYNETVYISNNITVLADSGAYINSLGSRSEDGVTNQWRVLGSGTVTNLGLTSDNGCAAFVYSVPGGATFGGAGRHVLRTERDVGLINVGGPSWPVASGTNYTFSARSILGSGGSHVFIYATNTGSVLDATLDDQTGFVVNQLDTGNIVYQARVNLVFGRLTGQVRPVVPTVATTNQFSMRGKDGLGIWTAGQVYTSVNRTKAQANPNITIQNVWWSAPTGSNCFYSATEDTSSPAGCTNTILLNNVVMDGATLQPASSLGYNFILSNRFVVSDWTTYLK